MRILFLSTVIDGLTPAPGEQFFQIDARPEGQYLFSPLGGTHVIGDDDVFVIDVEAAVQSSHPGGTNIAQGVLERVRSGGCVVVLPGPPGPNAPAWLPNFPGQRGERGERMEIDPGHDEFSAFLTRHARGVTYKTQFGENDTWRTAARSVTRFPVAIYAQYGAGFFFVLPELRNRARALRDLLDRVIPTYLPQLALEKAPPETQGPAWLNDFPIKPAQDLTAEIEALDQQLERFTAEQSAKKQRRAELLRYQNLLWYTGLPLEDEVLAALQLLGLPMRKGPPGKVDLIGTRPDGREVYIEVEGPKGPIDLDKGRQLDYYIDETAAPAEVEGAIVGNPFCAEHPNNRPPEGRQGGLFVKELADLARRREWPLVTTVEVFGWVRRHLEGDQSASAEARKILLLE